MNFAEYNTDENFDDNKSSLEELVKIGVNEGKSDKEIRDSLSPKWQKSSKIGQFDTYYETALKNKPKAEEPNVNDAIGLKALQSINAKPEAPKSNPPEKPAEEQVLEKVITETETPPKEENKNTLDEKTKSYMNTNNAISYAQEDNENERQSNELFKRWDARQKNIDKMSQSMRRIDDHMIDQLPTFMFSRYHNGEFGDPKSSDAKLRLAHFMINGVGTALSNMSHVIRKDGQTEDSDFEKYQKTNLEQGLENRWNKYKQETQSAIDIAKQGGMSEEAITDSIATISSNNRLQSAFNQMNERQKVFTLQVLGEVGDKMGNMNDAQFVNTLMGMSAMGDSLDPIEAAGMLVYRTVKDPEKCVKILSSLGLITNNIGGGFGNFIGGNNGNENNDAPATGTTLEDGTTVDPGKFMNNNEYKQLVAAGDKLSQQYYNGEIDEAKFRSEYAKLEKIMSEHGWFSFFRNKGIKSADDLIRINNNENLTKLDTELRDLNTLAKNGDVKPSEYDEKFANIRERASKWGANEKYLKSIDKGKVKKETIIKASEKKANKKK